MTIASLPRVSVLMTVHNAAEFVPIAIASVLTQSFCDWELVVVDDGSTDASPTILRSYADPRIRVRLLPHNIGRTPALQQAFEMGRGEYFAVLDADDVSRADRLATQVAHLDAHPEVLLVGSWARYIDEGGRVTGGWHPPSDSVELHEIFGWANPIVHSSAMYRAAGAIEVGGYPSALPYAQDYGLWLRLAARGAVGIIAEELCDQRIVASSMTRGRRFRTAVMRDSLALVRDAQVLLDFQGRAARRNRDAIMIAELKCSLADVRRGRLVGGLGAIIGAILGNPLGLLRSRAYRSQYLVGG